MNDNFDFSSFEDDSIDFNRSRSTRTKPGRPGEIEFDNTASFRRPSQLNSKNIDYLREPPKKRVKQVAGKSLPKNKSQIGLWALYLAWAICAIMSLRLLMMERGVIDYFRMKGTLDEKKVELEKIQAENEVIMDDIQQIKTDAKLQKQLARDHLGVIAPDEYLVIFAKERELSSR